MKEPLQILRVNSKVGKELARAAHDPHKHSYEEIIVVIKGAIEHFIDFDSTTLYAPFVGFITKGKVHHIKPKGNLEDCDGFIIRFQSEFVAETIFQLYHFFHEDAHIVFATQREFERFVSLSEILYEEAQKESLDYAILRSLLGAMLTILESEKRKTKGNKLVRTQDNPFLKFLALLEENFQHSVSVSFYAEQLFMSNRNLNLICQQILQKSASEIIQTRKLLEAKNLLLTTSKSISEIGFQIGYQEKAYFSNIFKKKTGQTPTEFRKEAKELFS